MGSTSVYASLKLHAGPMFSSIPQVFVVAFSGGGLLKDKNYPLSMKARIYWGLLGRYNLKKSARVIAVSEGSREYLVREVGLSQEKIDVVLNGVDPDFAPANTEHVTQIREKYRLLKPFLLCNGNVLPVKTRKQPSLPW